jgi:hypothetical protein
VSWQIIFSPEFEPEFRGLGREIRIELLAQAKLLEKVGHELGRPRVDTLKGSKYANMKELRFDAGDGVWRVAFAFDPEQKAILLVAGDKSGVKEDRFYKQLLRKADQRYGQHLAQLKEGQRNDDAKRNDGKPASKGPRGRKRPR